MRRRLFRCLSFIFPLLNPNPDDNIVDGASMLYKTKKNLSIIARKILTSFKFRRILFSKQDMIGSMI